MAIEYKPITLPGCDELIEPNTDSHETAVDWATGEVFSVHPLAARFPLLPDDELADLAEDIRANGLAVPILLNPVDHQLLDGRNRLRACDLARVEPHYQLYAGDDPAAAIIALNVHRRHITQGACSMAVALERLVTRRSGRSAAKAAGASRAGVGQASVVLQYAAELADRVMHGESLQDAYAEAQERKRRQEADAANLKALKTQQPMLAAQVEAGELTIGEAVAAARAIERTAAEESEIARLRQAIDLAREEIGSPLPLPASPPDLTLRFTEDKQPEFVRGATSADLKAEHEYLMRLVNLRRQVEALATEPPLVRVSWSDGHMNAVRSAAHGIITAAYGLVEVHEAALGDSARIRQVK